MPAGPDHYATLGVSPDAEDIVIHAAWKALLRKYHPDTNAGDDATQRSARINQAFAVLGNAHARATYDRARTERFGTPPPGFGRPPPRPVPPMALAAHRRRSRIAIVCGGALVLIVAALADPEDAADLRYRLADALFYRSAAAAIIMPARSLAATLPPPPPLPYLGAPETAPPPDRSAIARAARRAGRLVRQRGVAGAVAASQACDAAPYDWRAIDACTAFDEVAGIVAVSYRNRRSPLDPWFALAGQRDNSRYTGLDPAVAAIRLDTVRAQSRRAAFGPAMTQPHRHADGAAAAMPPAAANPASFLRVSHRSHPRLAAFVE